MNDELNEAITNVENAIANLQEQLDEIKSLIKKNDEWYDPYDAEIQRKEIESFIDFMTDNSK